MSDENSSNSLSVAGEIIPMSSYIYDLPLFTSFYFQVLSIAFCKHQKYVISQSYTINPNIEWLQQVHVIIHKSRLLRLQKKSCS